MISGRYSALLPKRRHTTVSGGEMAGVVMRRHEGRDSRPASRASFAGRRSSLNILDELKEVATPLQSPTSPGDGSVYEKIELTDVLKVGGSSAAAANVVKDPEETEPNSETTSLRDSDLPSAHPSTATTLLSERDGAIFSYDVSASPALAEVHGPGAGQTFHVDSPGRLIRATDSSSLQGGEEEEEGARDKSADSHTRF